MKKLVFILLFLPVVAFSQDNDYWFPVPQIEQKEPFLYRIPKPIKVTFVNFAVITFDAISDGIVANNDLNLPLAHTLDMISYTTLLVLPFCDFMEFKKQDWFWYITAHAFLRAGWFDLVYNYTRGFPVFGYRTDVSLWDKAVSAVNPPPGAEAYVRAWCITASIIFTFELK